MTSNRNRTAGHNWEREAVIDMKEATGEEWTTTRLESKALGNAGIDVMSHKHYITIQCKTTSNGINYQDLMSGKDDNHVILHKATKKSEGGKFMTKGKYAILNYNLFLKLLKTIHQQLS